ncbi:GPW/gp25 family protein [Gimesia algae]|uniref:Gene 25-like lysozyme n=1 Tax=Gimesia algae TaxID=2527971 RepID=A0A517VBS1_9PLAN|nr:GPW/gp25 family protein [Gimesia algae]QDT90460.1 Gene 25-like lysozyme [Gimesia algae]
MLHIDFSWSYDGYGQTATTTWREHKVDMLLQFLLTHPHERVNRPDFGTPLSRMCFEGNSSELSEVIQFVAKAGLQRWLGDVINIIELNAVPDESTLRVDLKYQLQGDEEIHEETAHIPFGGGVF